MIQIPTDWALYQTYIARELVYEIFTSKIDHRPVKEMPIGQLDLDTYLACECLADILAAAYSNPIHLKKFDVMRYNEALTKDEAGVNEKREQTLLDQFPPKDKRLLAEPAVVLDAGCRIIVWYLPGAMTNVTMNDMHAATKQMSPLLQYSVTSGKPNKWRTHQSNFHPSPDGKITPGCINISPAWFQQGREKHGIPEPDPEDGFTPEISAVLKKNGIGPAITTSLQRSSLLVSAALQVMHLDLYWAGIQTQVKLGQWVSKYGLEDMLFHLRHWTSVFNVVSIMCNHTTPPHRDPKCHPEAFDIMTTAGNYQPIIMEFMNLGIKLIYDSGSMLATCCRMVRHKMQVEKGNQITTAWFMRDSIHNFVDTPRTEYAKYATILDTNSSLADENM